MPLDKDIADLRGNFEGLEKKQLEVDSQLMTDIKRRRNKAIALKDKKYINQLLAQEYLVQEI
mgnify:CR=1 FL=1